MQVSRHAVVRVAVAVLLVAAVVTLLAGPAGSGPAAWTGLILEIQALQRTLHDALTEAMTAVAERGVAAAWGLIGLSFLYGVFHAAGPGHGKMVIATYLLTQESQLRRGIALSVAAAFVQGLTAVVLVEGALGLLGFTMRQAQGAVPALEATSYALIAAVGGLLAALRGRRVVARLRSEEPDGHHHHHHDAHCGHSHGPSGEDLARPMSWRAFVSMAVSIGIRPCSGSVLVLVVAHAVGLAWAGVASVVAISAGTAITVSALAALSVYARAAAVRAAAVLPGEAGRLSLALDVVAAAGGLAILVVGVAMFQAALAVPPHPLR